LGSHKTKHICSRALMMYPPMRPAEIFANCCQGDWFKYLELAGILKNEFY